MSSFRPKRAARPPPSSFRPEREARSGETSLPMETRFLHSAVLRTAPVEMTRGGGPPRIESGSVEMTMGAGPSAGLERELRRVRPPSSFRPERVARPPFVISTGAPKARSGETSLPHGDEVSPLRRAPHGSGRNDERGGTPRIESGVHRNDDGGRTIGRAGTRIAARPPPSSFRPERRRRAVACPELVEGEKPPCPSAPPRHFDRSAAGA